MTNEKPLEASTWAELAELCGVSQRRPYRWRKEPGAPQNKDLRAWLAWFQARGDLVHAGRVEAAIAVLVAAQGKNVPETAAPRAEESQPLPPVDFDTDPSKLQPVDVERRASLAAMQEKEERAAQARLQRLQSAKQTWPHEMVRELIRKLVGVQIEAMERKLWDRLAPLLDGIDSRLRGKIRERYAQAINEVRGELKKEGGQILADLRGQIR